MLLWDGVEVDLWRDEVRCRFRYSLNGAVLTFSEEAIIATLDRGSALANVVLDSYAERVGAMTEGLAWLHDFWLEVQAALRDGTSPEEIS